MVFFPTILISSTYTSSKSPRCTLQRQSFLSSVLDQDLFELSFLKQSCSWVTVQIPLERNIWFLNFLPTFWPSMTCKLRTFTVRIEKSPNPSSGFFSTRELCVCAHLPSGSPQEQTFQQTDSGAMLWMSMVLCRLMSAMASLTLAFPMAPASMDTSPGGDFEVTAHLEQHTISAIPATPDLFTLTVVRLVNEGGPAKATRLRHLKPLKFQSPCAFLLDVKLVKCNSSLDCRLCQPAAERCDHLVDDRACPFAVLATILITLVSDGPTSSIAQARLVWNWPVVSNIVAPRGGRTRCSSILHHFHCEKLTTSAVASLTKRKNSNVDHSPKLPV